MGFRRFSGFSVFILTLLVVPSALGQASIRLSWLTPGTEWTSPVTNGDFQAQGPLVAGQHPNPTGWSGFGEMSADPGTNTLGALVSNRGDGIIGR